ncbi:predicted protein [Naegleria gruberi]|uniref:Predicted protein n=1 Tax=Naegleria gruberi TaxID=5762 RepID=D2VX96_NAEGR|nr:uncharacterized protein NAEGRDRAFT_73666 [Naegleria gruberi]EFC38639.1 predicted protein [Naegleria gruberi]|eukprot:XP_002671383.1 predicted protein [Naegleria gruberi strain NEG-M]
MSTDNRPSRRLIREDIRKRLVQNPNPEVIDQIDTFMFHYLHERGFHNVIERYVVLTIENNNSVSLEVALNLFNKRRLIRFIQGGDFEKAINYLNQCKKFIRDAEFNTVMRRILYAYFPCLMLKGETARAMKLITDMENMGLYDQEAKLKYGDLLKFEKLSNVISREMVISKCAEVVTKDLENIEDHYGAENQDIPTKYEKLDPTSLILNMSNVFNAEPPSFTQTGNTYQMVVDNQPSSIWSDYSRTDRSSTKKKRSYYEYATENPGNIVANIPEPSTPSLNQQKHKYSISILDTAEVFKAPVHTIIYAPPQKPPKSNSRLMFLSKQGNNLSAKTFKTANEKLQDVPNYLLDAKYANFLQTKNDLLPAYTFGVNTVFMEAVKDDKFLLFKLETDKYFLWDAQMVDVNMTSILVEKDTSKPLVGTFDGRLAYMKYEHEFTSLIKLGDSPIIRLLDCSEGDLNLKYALARNGCIYRVDINAKGEVLPNTVVKYDSNICQGNEIPELHINPDKKTELVLRCGNSIQIITCGKKPNAGVVQFSKQHSKDIPDLTCICFSHDGSYIFYGKTNGEIQVVTTPNLLPRSTLTTLSNDYATCISYCPDLKDPTQPKESTGYLAIGTNSGKVVWLSLNTK